MCGEGVRYPMTSVQKLLVLIRYKCLDAIVNASIAMHAF